MELRDARPGAAIELPQGLYALEALTHCRATALDWRVFELAAEETEPVPLEGPDTIRPAVPILALIGDQLHGVALTEVEALPDDAELTVAHMIYRLRHHGEARGERSGRDGHTDFWLGPYRHYEREGHVLIFMDVHGEIQCLTGKAMDPRLVRVY